MKEVKSDNLKIAIIIGNSEYDNSQNLLACDKDLFYINGILEASNEFHEILQIKNEYSTVATDKIVAFIEKYRDKKIEQVFFYFTGHGYRNSEDFYYCLKNTSTKNIRTTSLSNKDIDGYLKSLKPNVATKIIDACYAGEQYIKETNEDNFLKLSQSQLENTFNEIYFMFSSKSDETSETNKRASAFTEIFLEAIFKQDQSNQILYKYLIDYLRDNGIERLNHTPYFVTQGTNLAYMFKNSEPIKDFLREHFIRESSQTDDIKELDLLALIKAESLKYCSQEEGINRINQVFSTFEEYNFRSEIISIFDIEHTYSKNIEYNQKSVGEWLLASQEKNILAKVNFGTITESRKEYVKQPKKPSNSRNIGFTLANLFGEDEYKLEEVKVHKKVVEGIQYLISHDKFFLQITLKAKQEFESIQDYTGCFAILFSKKTLFLFHCFEKLSISSWNNYSSPKCLNWKVHSLSLKEPNIKFLETLMREFEEFILEDIKLSLSLKHEEN